MADPKLVEILQQGSEVWNRWREQQSEDLPIDLSHANLSYASLSRANLCHADLSEAILVDASLSGADLSEAILCGTCLDAAKLNEANLSVADLSHATLVVADLSDANLSDTDLSHADLSHANLIRANLYHTELGDANLNHANLCDADLSDADLRRANLSKASLHGASLHGTDLSRTYLNQADLSNTGLSHANLRNANLRDTSLKKANWTHARIGWTQFDNIDFRGGIGLESVQHDGPSTIGLDTIYRSHGQIPEVFLRGAGVPETFITNMRALVASISPIDFYTCFISYSHQNEDFAKRLYADLQAQGVRCWFANEDLKIGDHYHQRIDEAIRLYDKLILVLSVAAVQSAWVEREVVAAREKEDRQQREVLFPIQLDDTVMMTDKAWAADVRRRWHIGDFTKWKDHDSYQQAFERLLRDLKAESKEEKNG